MKSKLHTSERVENADRKFGAAPYYYPVTVSFENGREEPALFTLDQILVAIQRAKANPEDVPRKSLWAKLFS